MLRRIFYVINYVAVELLFGGGALLVKLLTHVVEYCYFFITHSLDSI